MSGVNKVIIIGRLGQDPEMKAIGQGTTVTRLSVATSENWMGKDGQKQERTEWHRIVVWGKLAEICGKYLVKGRQVYVEGRLQTNSYEKNGVKMYSTEIVANTVQFLGSVNSDTSVSAGGASTSMNPSHGNDAHFKDDNADFGPEPTFNQNEDIPF